VLAVVEEVEAVVLVVDGVDVDGGLIIKKKELDVVLAEDDEEVEAVLLDDDVLPPLQAEFANHP